MQGFSRNMAKLSGSSSVLWNGTGSYTVASLTFVEQTLHPPLKYAYDLIHPTPPLFTLLSLCPRCCTALPLPRACPAPSRSRRASHAHGRTDLSPRPLLFIFRRSGRKHTSRASRRPARRLGRARWQLAKNIFAFGSTSTCIIPPGSSCPAGTASCSYTCEVGMSS